MGQNIKMCIVQNNEKIADNIFKGRNSAWFIELQGDCLVQGIEHFPCCNGISIFAPKDYRTTDLVYEMYGNIYITPAYYIPVQDFINWFESFRPDISAGWVNTYDRWLYEKKHIEPKLLHELPKEIQEFDWHFIEVEDKYNLFKWLYDYIINNNIPTENTDIQYYFC